MNEPKKNTPEAPRRSVAGYVLESPRETAPGSEYDPEYASEKEKLSRLNSRKKLQYLWDYYKLHFVIGCVLLYIAGYLLYGHFTQKETVLYAAFINVAPSEALTAQLRSGFLASQGLEEKKYEFDLYTDLYLSNGTDSQNPEYAYASRIKLMGVIESETLDVALMDQDAFDLFSQNGYLYNIEDFLSETDPALYGDCRELIRENVLVLEDNAEEAALDSSVSYTAETEEYPGALEISQAPLLKEAGFTEPVYLGVIQNTPRKETAAEYIRYLLGEPLPVQQPDPSAP